jgi:hypothetical protein
MFLIISKYEGTRLGRQELMGDIFEEAEGALWTRDMVDRARWPALALPAHGRRRRPGSKCDASSALTGIVVAARASISGAMCSPICPAVSHRMAGLAPRSGDLVRHTLSNGAGQSADQHRARFAQQAGARGAGGGTLRAEQGDASGAVPRTRRPTCDVGTALRRAMIDWQSIETAPKDGTRLLLIADQNAEIEESARYSLDHGAVAMG